MIPFSGIRLIMLNVLFGQRLVTLDFLEKMSCFLLVKHLITYIVMAKGAKGTRFVSYVLLIIFFHSMLKPPLVIFVFMFYATLTHVMVPCSQRTLAATYNITF